MGVEVKKTKEQQKRERRRKTKKHMALELPSMKHCDSDSDSDSLGGREGVVGTLGRDQARIDRTDAMWLWLQTCRISVRYECDSVQTNVVETRD